MGLKHYWGQFPGLRERMIEYGQFITKKVESFGAEVFFYGLVDCEQEGKKAGEYFNEKNVDLIFCTFSYLCNQCVCTAGSSNL